MGKNSDNAKSILPERDTGEEILESMRSKCETFKPLSETFFSIKLAMSFNRILPNTSDKQ